MRRRSTIFSIPSMLILVILLVGLGLTIWRQGGLAFSPGDLSSTGSQGVMLEGYKSHADFEKQCSSCHQPLSSLQAELCMECHTGIGDQITMQNSLHGKLEDVMQCAACHSDHQGRQHDLKLGSLDDFDHSLLAFSLIWHRLDYDQEPIACLDCHVTDSQFSVPNASCSNCHAGADGEFVLVHAADFGDGCVECHDGLDSLARFEHINSDFPLEGVHQEVACAACHVQGQFAALPSDCAACHVEPPLHSGMFGTDCAACHNSQAWSPALVAGATFDHNTHTRFSLELHPVDFQGNDLSCQGCHVEEISGFSQETCFGCHALDDESFMLEHKQDFGGSCLECHDGTDRMRTFDHQAVFPLDGSHLQVDCQGCHVNQLYQDTPSLCRDCHTEPEIHLGFFGLTCEYCHETSSWYPAQLTRHTFPIEHGGRGESDCQTCHISSYAEYTCYSCHEHSSEEVIKKHREFDMSAGELSNCVACHLDGQVHEFVESEQQVEGEP